MVMDAVGMAEIFQRQCRGRVAEVEDESESAAGGASRGSSFLSREKFRH